MPSSSRPSLAPTLTEGPAAALAGQGRAAGGVGDFRRGPSLRTTQSSKSKDYTPRICLIDHIGILIVV